MRSADVGTLRTPAGGSTTPKGSIERALNAPGKWAKWLRHNDTTATDSDKT